MHKSKHAFHNAVQVQSMLDGVGWGVDAHIDHQNLIYHIGHIKITLWQNLKINKPIFELANSARFTEYLRTIFKSLPPNIYFHISFNVL